MKYVNLTTRPARRQSYADWSEAWTNTLFSLRSFITGGSFYGRRRHPDSARMALPVHHRLGGDDLGQWRDDNEECLIDYVVYSYSTPIAWHRSGLGWYIVDQKFSPTTSKHQSIIRRFA